MDWIKTVRHIMCVYEVTLCHIWLERNQYGAYNVITKYFRDTNVYFILSFVHCKLMTRLYLDHCIHCSSAEKLFCVTV